MELSKRITGLTGGGSDGWGILYAARALEAGQYVANLTIGEHDIRTQDIILDAMHARPWWAHGYASVPGTGGLRHSVAQRITQRTGVKTEPQNVLVTPGARRRSLLRCWRCSIPGTGRSSSIPIMQPTPEQFGEQAGFRSRSRHGLRMGFSLGRTPSIMWVQTPHRC